MCDTYYRMPKKDFHIQCAKIRTTSARISLKMEECFDSIFVDFISDAYYSRSFVEKYNERMEKSFSEFEVLILEELYCT